MQLNNSRRLILVFVAAAFLVSAALVSATAAEDAQVKVVDVTQKGAPPSGPYPVVVEHDQKLATHTIYRPATLGPSKHPVVVWGEGACVKNGLSFPEFLSEIASYGFVIVADGPRAAGGTRWRACWWGRPSGRATRSGAGWKSWAGWTASGQHQCRRHSANCCH